MAEPAAPADVAAAPKVAFKTLGCRLNQAESEQALEGLGARGFDLAHAGETPDVVVINTCTVTAESTASSRRLIRKTAEANPQATVVVTGCYAVADPAYLLLGHRDSWRAVFTRSQFIRVHPAPQPGDPPETSLVEAFSDG